MPLLEVASAIALAAGAIAAVPEPRACEIASDVQLFDRVSDMPDRIQQDVALLGPMAEAGQLYNFSDGIEDATLPFQRFVRGGRKGDLWFVWYEHGGISHSDIVLGWLPNVSAEEPRLVLGATLTGNPCAAIDAVLSGVLSDPRLGELKDRLWAI